MKFSEAWAGPHQDLVVGHPVGFAQRDRRESVSVHPPTVLVHRAIGLHVGDQVGQSRMHDLLVVALDVRLARSEKR